MLEQNVDVVSIKKSQDPHKTVSLMILSLTVLAYFIFDNPRIAMWFGFFVAGYSAIANDSIQTLGTFLASNKNLPWYWLWLFIGGILILCLFLGWHFNNGDIAYGRLHSIPTPLHFTFLELLAPICLIALTYLRMPVSTTFLLLSVFSSHVVIQKMLVKTFLGYSVAFAVGLIIFLALMHCLKFLRFKNNYNQRRWRVLQFLSTGYLWIAWIMHDTANVTVFLPRNLNFLQMVLAVAYLFFVIGLLMFLGGGRIQKIVTDKTATSDIRSATIIDFVYACLLIFFIELNHIPMSTTWVFLGLLAGREIGLRTLNLTRNGSAKVAKIIVSDITKAGIGLLLSLVIALA